MKLTKVQKLWLKIGRIPTSTRMSKWAKKQIGKSIPYLDSGIIRIKIMLVAGQRMAKLKICIHDALS